MLPPTGGLENTFDYRCSNTWLVEKEQTGEVMVGDDGNQYLCVLSPGCADQCLEHLTDPPELPPTWLDGNTQTHTRTATTQ